MSGIPSRHSAPYDHLSILNMNKIIQSAKSAQNILSLNRPAFTCSAQSPQGQVPLPQTLPPQSGPVQPTAMQQPSPFQSSQRQMAAFQASPMQTSPFQAPPAQMSPFQPSPMHTSPFGTPPAQMSQFGTPSVQMSPFGASPMQMAQPLQMAALLTPLLEEPLRQATQSYQAAQTQAMPPSQVPPTQATTPSQVPPMQTMPPLQAPPMQTTAPLQAPPEQTTPFQAHTPPQPATQIVVPRLINQLRKGQKVALDPTNEVREIKVCLGWNVSNPDCDIDVSAFILGADGNVPGDDWFVFYGQEYSPDKSVFFSSSGAPDRQYISVDFNKLNPLAKKIVFVLTINDATVNQLNFSMVKDAYVRILNAASRQELVSFQMTDYYSNVISMMICELYLHNGSWKCNAIGNGVARDLAGLCELYGVSLI